jgi:YD repeat-containing protein
VAEALTIATDGSVMLRRASGRIDRFEMAPGGAGLFALTPTTDTLAQNSDGTYTLRTPGSTVTKAFAAGGQLAAIQDSGAARVTFDYDKGGNLTAAHYHGRLIQFTHDSAGRIASITDAAGRTVGYSYSADGHLSQQTNADGQTVGYQYDDSGNLVSVTYGSAAIGVSYGSDTAYVSVASVTTPDGAVRKYDIPQEPTQIRVTDGNGDATLYVSGAAGWLLSATDANGNAVSYTYDAGGHRLSTTEALGETSKFTYDSIGNLTAITDALGNRWSADYSAAGPAHITDPNGNVWALTYDSAGNLAAVGDAGVTRTAAGQISSYTDALGNTRTYQYSADGLPNGYTDPLGGNWQYGYDGAARVSSRTDPTGTVIKPPAYDFSSYQRDGLNRLVTYTDSFGNPIAYRYDGAGQLTGLTLPGGKTVKYQYDHAHRLSMVTDWLGNFAIYRYDAAGWPVSVSVSGGPVTIYQYDAARRLKAIVSTGPDGTPAAGYRYTLDANGNRTGVTALEANPAKTAIPAYSFTLDAANHPVSRSDGQTYRFDGRLNLNAIQGSRTATLAYDSVGRLQGFIGDNATSYTYDSAGLRSVRTVNGADRRLIYDPSGPAPRVVMEADSSNAPVAWYVYGLGLLWKVTADGTTYFYHFDGDGNVVAVSNPATGVVNQYRYDPQGRLLSAKEGIENQFRSHGEAGWVDDGNGLILSPAGYQFPEVRLTLPASVDLAPPFPTLLPAFHGAGACFLDGVADCLFSTGRRTR